MDNKKKIYTTLKDGSKKEYDVICTFKNEENGKNYIVYTDNSYNDKNKLKVYAAIYDEKTFEFIEVPESKEEWNMIYKVIDKVVEE